MFVAPVLAFSLCHPCINAYRRHGGALANGPAKGFGAGAGHDHITFKEHRKGTKMLVVMQAFVAELLTDP